MKLTLCEPSQKSVIEIEKTPVNTFAAASSYRWRKETSACQVIQVLRNFVKIYEKILRLIVGTSVGERPYWDCGDVL
jgi:hypothetical protein